jgi:uncharacterized protein YlxW (UPF0749 family)
MTDRPARVDASMSLLLDTMRNPLDPGYALAAAHRDKRAPRRVAGTLLLALVGGVLLAAAAVDLRPQALSGARDRARLQAEISRRVSAAESVRAGNARLRAEIARAQQSALASADQRLSGQLEQLELTSGESPVQGSGLRYTVSDAPSVRQTVVGQDPRENTSTDQGRVLDRDLQIVVNGLWAAGAEAIAVNGQRLTSLSAIRSAGEAILVDFRPLVPPYRIEAIGDPARLQAGFAENVAGSYVQSLRDNYGIRVSVASVDRLQLPGAGSLVLHQARDADVAAPLTPSASSSSPEVPS